VWEGLRAAFADPPRERDCYACNACRTLFDAHTERLLDSGRVDTMYDHDVLFFCRECEGRALRLDTSLHELQGRRELAEQVRELPAVNPEKPVLLCTECGAMHAWRRLPDAPFDVLQRTGRYIDPESGRPIAPEDDAAGER